MRIPQLCKNKWPTLPLWVDFKWKPGLIRAFESSRVNTCPLNTNHQSFAVCLLAIRSCAHRPADWDVGTIMGVRTMSMAPCPAWEGRQGPGKEGADV